MSIGYLDIRVLILADLMDLVVEFYKNDRNSLYITQSSIKQLQLRNSNFIRYLKRQLPKRLNHQFIILPLAINSIILNPTLNPKSKQFPLLSHSPLSTYLSLPLLLPTTSPHPLPPLRFSPIPPPPTYLRNRRDQEPRTSRITSPKRRITSHNRRRRSHT
ncbi:hypothetical protein EYC80_001376 [Monilinia laxa]|uniref:Uncharacterized protein n=1 Tax=Monilinia laxa TaxID=61186 RepID=A0A5N6K965_MONLA|nr:hypothetical protein EYC80_001376 [Monilinia laxa]